VSSRTGRSTLTFGAMFSCIVCLFYLGLWGVDLRMRRPWAEGLTGFAEAYGRSSRLYPMAATALLSGFRGLAADLLWLKADGYWHHGQWQRMLPMYHAIVALQPQFTLVWSVGGWHMAYNLSEYARRDSSYTTVQREEQARRWIDEGILFLQSGLKYNQDKEDLYFDLGWTYFDKVKDYAAAIGYLETAYKKSESMLTGRVLAHAYDKAGRMDEAHILWQHLKRRGDAVATRWLQKEKGD
jgi:tetratricopeptide (TPR) repeat protein